MVIRIKPLMSCRIIIILLVFMFLFISLLPLIASQQSQMLTQDEFKQELIKAYNQNNVEMANVLILNNRLLVKPIIDGLIRECIAKELNGKTTESNHIRTILEKAAGSFENIFGEKSLTIAVNYLTIWSKDQKEKKLLVDSLYAVGTKYRLGNEPQKAIDAYQKGLILYCNIGDERGEAEVLGGLGAVYFNNIQDLKEALKYYNEALIKREKVNDKVLIGNTLSSIGSIYHDYFKDYAQAIDYLDRAEAVRREIGDSINLGRTIHVKASALEKSGQSEKALDYFRKSYEMNRKYGDKTRMAQAMLHSGIILNNTGKYSEALEQLEKSLELYRDLKSPSGEGNVLNQLGFVYSNLGDLNLAIEKINEASEIMKELNDTEGLAGVYNHFGIVLQNAGRFDKALEFYNRSYGIYSQNEDKTLLLPLLSNIGTVYMDLKNYTKAEDYHLRGLQICRENNEIIEETHFLLNLANDQIMLGKLNEAKANYDSADEIARSLDNPDLSWRILAGMAEYHEQKGEFKKAVELNDSALNVLEGVRSTLQTKEQKTSFMASERYVYEDIISLLEMLNEKERTMGYDKLAFQYVERGKSRVLLDLLTESSTKINKGTYQRSEDLKNPEPVSLKEAKTLCQDRNTIILEYLIGDSSSCLWVITKSNYKLFRLPNKESLLEQNEIIRFALQDPEEKISDFFIQAGNFLYEKLVKPAEPYLSKKSRLIIIPDGILNYLPFEVLLTGTEGISPESSYSSLPFLVKKYPVSYGQSASVLKSLLSEQKGSLYTKSGKKKLIAFGDPAYEDTSQIKLSPNYSRLEYSGKEVENIASFFKKGNVEIYLRDDATEDNVKREGELKKFNYVHFATHGIIDENEPDLSSLILTQNRKSAEDGFLRATEIFNLDLYSDLVVLSACQTGLGKLIRGEGIVGLTRAFMYAGTPSILVSLWSVSDISTANLMGEFYKNLIKNKLSKTEALRKAQLTLMSDEKYAHPFYWAPFVLIGDWR